MSLAVALIMETTHRFHGAETSQVAASCARDERVYDNYLVTTDVVDVSKMVFILPFIFDLTENIDSDTFTPPLHYS